MTTPGARWTLELYKDADGRCPYQRFIDGLDDATFAALDAAVEYVFDAPRHRPVQHGVDEASR